MSVEKLVELNEQYEFYNKETGTWTISFRDMPGMISCSTNIDMRVMTLEQMQEDKPFYLGVMARRQQLQPILDNPHLFDPAFVNAVRLLFIEYDKMTISQ